MNLYAYANNNPVRFSDSLGLAPGDLFDSADAAAADAIRYINPTSIAKNREFAGWIYKRWFGFGSYSYTVPIEGTEAGSDPGSCPIWHSKEGGYHTHGAYDPKYDSENFSPNDKDIADYLEMPIFLGVPSGDIKKYVPVPGRPRAGAITTIGRGAL